MLTHRAPDTSGSSRGSRRGGAPCDNEFDAIDVARNRGHFPTEQAVLKVLYLAVRNLEEYRRPTGRDPQLGLEASDDLL